MNARIENEQLKIVHLENILTAVSQKVDRMLLEFAPIDQFRALQQNVKDWYFSKKFLTII